MSPICVRFASNVSKVSLKKTQVNYARSTLILPDLIDVCCQLRPWSPLVAFSTVVDFSCSLNSHDQLTSEQDIIYTSVRLSLSPFEVLNTAVSAALFKVLQKKSVIGDIWFETCVLICERRVLASETPFGVRAGSNGSFPSRFPEPMYLNREVTSLRVGEGTHRVHA